MIKITVEELDIVVQASVEQALTEFKKIVPNLKRTIKQVEDNLNNVDAKGMTNKVQQAVQQVKQKINEVKNTNIDKHLQSQFSKARASVERYQGQLDQVKEKLRQVYAEMDNIQANTWKAYTPEGVKLGNRAIEPAVNSDLANNKQYQNLSKQASKLEEQIVSINAKLNTTKQEYGQIAGQIQQTTAKQSIWNNAVNKVRVAIAGIRKNISNTGNSFQSVSDISDKIKNSCNQILKLSTKVVTKVKQIGTGFKQGLGHILRYAGALLSLQTIYSALSGSANAWLSSQNTGAQQLQANIDYLKTSFGSILAPVIEYVVNLVYQLMKAIQSLVYALSGVNIFANASAKAYESMASSAKEANKQTKQLVGVHSEINNISSNDSSSSGSGGSTAPSFDLSQIDSQMSPLAKKLYDFFKPLVESWKTYGASLVEQVKTTASQIGSLLSSVWGSFEKIITNGTVYSILENILAIIGNIAQAWANAWNYNNNGDAIVQNLANAFNKLLKAINNVVRSQKFQKWLKNCSDKFREISEKIASIDWQPLIDALVQIGTSIGTVALDILSRLVDIFKWIVENPDVSVILASIAASIMLIVKAIESISGILTTIEIIKKLLDGKTFSSIAKSIGGISAVVIGAITAISSFVSMLSSGFDWLKEVIMLVGIAIVAVGAVILGAPALVAAVVAAIVAAIATAIVVVKEHWEDISNTLSNGWEWLKQKAEEIWNAIAEFFTNLWQNMSQTASNTWNGIKDFFVNIWTNISTFFSNIWNGIKNTASNIWNGIKTVINNAINGIKTTISNVLNTIKTIWNNIWNGLKTTVTNIFNSIWNTIRKIINSILGGIEGMANGIISGVNAVIRVLNNLSFEIPDWVPVYGGSRFGFNISLLRQISLPRLAKGAVLTVPTVAEMAEYPGASQNPEIVTPQNIMEETFDKVLARYQDNDNSQPINLAVYVGNAKLGQILLDDLRNMKRRSGKDIEALVGG